MLGSRSRRSTSAVSYGESDLVNVQPHLARLQELLGHAPHASQPQSQHQAHSTPDGTEDANATPQNEDGSQTDIVHNLDKPWSDKVRHHLQELRQVMLQRDSTRAQDVFRHLQGFTLLLDILKRAAAQPQSDNEPAELTLQQSWDIIRMILEALAAAVHLHDGNQRFFRSRVRGNGWDALRAELQSWITSLKKPPDVWNRIQSELFVCLRRCAFGDVNADSDKIPGSDSLELSTNGARHDTDAIQAVEPSSTIEFITLLVQIGADDNTALQRLDQALLQLLPLILRLTTTSAKSLARIREARVLPALLLLLQGFPASEAVGQLLQETVIQLLSRGLDSFSDAQFLYRGALSNPRIASALESALSTTLPPFFEFDLSVCGHASLEIQDIGHPFPPSSATPGYTLLLWLYIDRFDANVHTTLFGAFDASQTCFVLLYLEKTTQKLVLQTSVTSSKPSIRFESTVFETGRWYHLCLVHRRPRGTSSSRASLYVDGEFVEQVKAHFPSSPSHPGHAARVEPSDHPDSASRPVQAFLGTPQDLSTATKLDVLATRWRLSSAHLLGDTLSDDLIAVFCELGPRYFGNFQDSLGSFQTYRASAALNLRNENLHPGKEEKSDIVTVIRSKASTLLSESKIILNISPMSSFEDPGYDATGQQIVRYLSKPAFKTLRQASRGGRFAVATNGATPAFNEGLSTVSHTALLAGCATPIIPQCLDSAAWRLGGCTSVVLSILRAAETPDEVIRALNIVFAVVQVSWRNSEAMEKENGFAILATFLREKVTAFVNDENDDADETADLPLRLLRTILKFVGLDDANPENSIMINPLAYRVLIVDSNVWRICSMSVQKTYYSQFETFAVGSKHHVFNAKRLARMRVVRKWLEALKSEPFFEESIDGFLRAFRVLLGPSFSAETHRAIALFVSYAVHRRISRSLPSRSGRSTRLPSKMGPPNSISIARAATFPLGGSSTLTKREGLSLSALGARILQLYADVLCQKDTLAVRKFARAVTNKWLLHLIADEDPTIVTLATQILARVLVANGSSYVEKFAERTGGFIILKHRLRRRWNVSALWTICFAIFFGKDVATLDLQRPLDLYTLLQAFPPAESRVMYPVAVPVLITMLQLGIKHLVQAQDDEGVRSASNGTPEPPTSPSPITSGRLRSKSLRSPSAESEKKGIENDTQGNSNEIIRTVVRFLADLQHHSQHIRDYAASSQYVQELLFLLFPMLVSSDVVSAETELHSRDASLTFNGNDVLIRPMSQSSNRAAPIVRTQSVDEEAGSRPARAPPLKRGSSFVLVTAEQSPHQPSKARLETIASPKKAFQPAATNHALIEEIVEMAIAAFTDQILYRKDFPGIGLFMKVPPAFQEHQAYFKTYMLSHLISHLKTTIKLRQKLLWEPRVLTNLQRFCTHLDEAVYEGWFIDGADLTFDFIGDLLEYLQQKEVRQIKSVRLCSEVIASMRIILSRICLLRLSEPDSSPEEKTSAAFLRKINYWQTVLLAPASGQDRFLRLFCYMLYMKLVSNYETVRDIAADIWRALELHKADEMAGLFSNILDGADDQSLSIGFAKIMEGDNLSFLAWIDDHRPELDAAFFGKLGPMWENFVAAENRATESAFRARVSKRRGRLKAWATETLSQDDIIRKHEVTTEHWRSNISASEHLKHQRLLQDEQDAQVFNMACWSKMETQLKRPCGLLADDQDIKWRLDLTEGRNRMRTRLLPDRKAHLLHYSTKGTPSKTPPKAPMAVDTRRRGVTIQDTPIAPSPVPKDSPAASEAHDSASLQSPRLNTNSPQPETEEDYEMVEEPETEPFEDKNRKVMRSLQRNDQVEHVHNMSRIIGLEACEGLLIVGRIALYLLDDFFQRSDGEIVDVHQAPADERDLYMQMISGRQAKKPAVKTSAGSHESRSWRWEEILSISKRRFLFRDVGLEIFFVDGESYLLTVSQPRFRDELFQRLMSKAQSCAGSSLSSSPEHAWRLQALRTSEDAPQTLGSRFTNVFSQSASNPATKQWLRGEMSNFNYLMHINTMAGRTFNDLTQYPVFPWVLADYTSEELDLSNPRSYRDLSKPMGCQTAERQAEFRDRYQAFTEMGDGETPAFHYGTHYSSAMIVTGYLIRLQPFVQSYLLLQGGSFDHPDRLFYSIEKAWRSAARENMTDVRELIPEFFCLPAMFVNINGYDFGARQGTGGKIDNVALPPWAKGDPKIFVAKHREALESEYVSRHLPLWIDLVFGHKQRGEAAIEATNVFHHLSYRGARNLDEIDDPVERMATIGIIHNFGQTPHQVFQRPHPMRVDSRMVEDRRLETAVTSLTKLPFPLLESTDRVASLVFSAKREQLLCSGPFRSYMPPNYEVYAEWGFIDGSIRFLAADTDKSLAVFEHIHEGQLSAATFVDSRTLVTAGNDGVIGLWTVRGNSKHIELHSKGHLFGHHAAVTCLVVAPSFSTLVSASADGVVLVWDLNGRDLIRVLARDRMVECMQCHDLDGTILLCQGPRAAIFTINGELLLEQHVCVEGDEVVTSCAFDEGAGSADYLQHRLIFTGHRRGAVNVWSIIMHDGRFELEHVKRLVHTDAAGYILPATITCILPLMLTVYTGDEDGRVHQWDCIPRTDGR